MKVRISKEKVFWNSITDNKPHQNYFDEFTSRMIESNLQVNQDNFLTITVATQNRDITYIEIEHRDYTGYYYYNSIQQITNAGYIITFKLDIWTTFTLPFLKNLSDNSVKVKVIRNHVLSKESAIYTDNLLNAIPITYNGIITNYETTTTGEQNVSQSYQRLYFNNNNSYIEWKHPSPNITVFAGNTLTYYYVFKEVGDKGSLIFLPLIDETNNYELYYQINDGFNDKLDRTRIYNNRQKLEELRRTTEWSNKFLGCYLLPNFFNFQNTQQTYNWITYNNEKYISLVIKVEGLRIIGNSFKLLGRDKLNLLDFTEQVPSLNYSDKLHVLGANLLNYEYMGQTINLPLFWTKDNGISINSWLVNFTQCGYIKFENQYSTYSQNIYQLPSDLPVWIDNYQNYVNGNKYQRDNQINIWKQQRDIQISKNAINYGLSTFSNLGAGLSGIASILTGNVGGGVKQITSAFTGQIRNTVDTSFGIADAVLGYQNSINTLNAQYRDYKNTMGDTIQAGSITDAVIGYYNYKPLGAFSVLLPSYNISQYRNLTKETIMQINNIFYLYGNYNPKYDTLSNLQPRTDFNYLVFEIEYLRTIFNQYINANVPVELYSHILETLISGVRICKTNTPMNN